MKLENPVILIGGAPFACGITKMLSAGSCVPIIGSFDLGLQPDRAGEFAVVYPMPQHELILILDA